jgi:hypothetical protein
MTTIAPISRTRDLLELMKRGDDAFNSRDPAAMSALHRFLYPRGNPIVSAQHRTQQIAGANPPRCPDPAEARQQLPGSRRSAVAPV